MTLLEETFFPIVSTSSPFSSFFYFKNFFFVFSQAMSSYDGTILNWVNEQRKRGREKKRKMKKKGGRGREREEGRGRNAMVQQTNCEMITNTHIGNENYLLRFLLSLSLFHSLLFCSNVSLFFLYSKKPHSQEARKKKKFFELLRNLRNNFFSAFYLVHSLTRDRD